MATTLTFASLKTDIANYLERGGSAITDETVYNQIPRFVNNAERALMQQLKLLGTLEVLVDAPTGLATGVSVYTKPDRLRTVVSMNFGTGATNDKRTPLFPRSYEYVRTYWPDSTQTDVPKFYADYDYSHWTIAPTPDADYPWEILAYLQPVLLDDSNQTNFFTDYCQNALLFGSLLQAAPFLFDDPRLSTWANLYGTEISTLDSQDLQRQLDRAAVRNRP